MSDNDYLWLWVLGWILCFPIPLTILIIRGDLSPILKGLLTALLWAALAAAGYFGYMYGYPYVMNRFFPAPVEQPAPTPVPVPAEPVEDPQVRQAGIVALQEFCDDFSENGTYETLEAALAAHGLYAGRLKHGEESEVCKVSYTQEGANVVTEADLSQNGNYALVTFLLGEENRLDSVQLHTDTQLKIPEDSRRDTTLHGRGYADEGTDMPDYENVVGYLVPSAYQMALLERNEYFDDESAWEVPTYGEDEDDIEKLVELDPLPHKTLVVCRDQNLEHLGYGLYTGTLLVETLDGEEEEYYVNVKNFITKPYWVYKTDIRNAVAVGYVVATYHQVSSYPPRGENGEVLIETKGKDLYVEPVQEAPKEEAKDTDEDEDEDDEDDDDWDEDDWDNWDEEESTYLEDGTHVLVTGVGGLSGIAENDVEAYYWNEDGVRVKGFFNSADLQILY